MQQDFVWQQGRVCIINTFYEWDASLEQETFLRNIKLKTF